MYIESFIFARGLDYQIFFPSLVVLDRSWTLTTSSAKPKSRETQAPGWQFQVSHLLLEQQLRALPYQFDMGLLVKP